MSLFFDEDLGVIKRTAREIVELEKQWLEQNTNIRISDDANIYTIISGSLALIYEEILNSMEHFFESTTSQSGQFNKVLQNISLIKSTTFEAVRDALLELKEVRFVNIVSGQGKVSIYLILKKEYGIYLKESDSSKFKDSTDAGVDPEILNQISDFKSRVWDVLYNTCPVGTHFEGDVEIDKFNSHNQKKVYKFSLGKVKYAYIKAAYQMDLKNSLYLNVDTQIRKIYKRIINNNYTNMGLKFEYMDFYAPVNEIRGMHCLEVSVAIKDNDKYPITDSTNIKPSDFHKNEDQAIQASEFLDVSCRQDRLAIDIK